MESINKKKIKKIKEERKTTKEKNWLRRVELLKDKALNHIDETNWYYEMNLKSKLELKK